MGLLLAFAVGWLVGGRAGNEGLDEMIDAIKGVASSEELRGLLHALRSHTSHALKEIGARLTDDDDPLTIDEVVERLRQIVAQGIDDLTSNAS